MMQPMYWRHAGRLEDLAGVRHCPREINQRALELRPGTQGRREQRARAATDIHDRPHRLPAPGDLELRGGRAVSGRPDERVEARRDLRVGV
jgi:hypothetical protein